MKLRKQDQEFRNPKVFYPDPKAIDLDRVLVNMFLLLRCDGTRPAMRGRLKASVEKVSHHSGQLAEMAGVKGFDEHPEIAKAWLESNLFDLVNRGKANEAVASLRPLHLDAHKIRIAKNCRDYNCADALYAMLSFGERHTLSDLKAYLDRGRDAATNTYDGDTQLDLETLTVLKLVEDLPNLHPSGDRVATSPPLCIGQSRVLCDDIQRLLAYQDEVPRPVMIDYLKAVLGLHIGMCTLRSGRQLSGWLRDRQPHEVCRECPVHGSQEHPFVNCPYQQYFTVDMSGDFRSRMAQLAQESAAAEYGRLTDLVRSVLAINQLLRYAREDKSLGVPEDPWDVFMFLSDPPEQFDADFRAILKQLRNENEARDEQLAPEEEAILNAGLSPFETFVELIFHVRQKHHMKYLTQFIDKLFQKNGEYGASVQGKSKNNPRRWHLGGRLLEVFVQLAVLKWEERESQKRFYSEPILIEDFLHWIEARYGFVIGEPQSENGRAPVTLDEHRAFRANVKAFKDRLREIGFYDDLSDAYNVQTIRPRYPINQR
ncbi:MAG: hypothetical protein GXX96_02010 [Planctomycetaceae bacterium]|nr:hypothetical protein [Planctomycetaceae bacterium]